MAKGFTTFPKDQIEGAIKPHFKQLGWDEITTYLEMGPDYYGYRLSVVTDIILERDVFSNGPNYKTIENIVKPFFDKLYNSPIITKLNKQHEEELQVLRDQLAVVEESNHNLTALLAEELEYIEVD